MILGVSFKHEQGLAIEGPLAIHTREGIETHRPFPNATKWPNMDESYTSLSLENTG